MKKALAAVLTACAITGSTSGLASAAPITHTGAHHASNPICELPGVKIAKKDAFTGQLQPGGVFYTLIAEYACGGAARK